MATIISIIGILVTALLITVASQKLLLSRWERYVHDFFLNSELAKKRKHQAANIIIYAWRMWRLTKMNKHTSIQYIKTQQAFLKSLDEMKKIKQKQRKLNDNSAGLAELVMAQRDISVTIDQAVHQMAEMKWKLDTVEKKLSDINQTVDIIQNLLSQFLDRVMVSEHV